MRIVRRASVILSLVLVVAIVVGYLGRRSEISEVRDQQLTRASEVVAARVDALADATRIAADASTAPIAAVDAVRGAFPSVSACATDDVVSTCDGPLATLGAGLELAVDGAQPIVVASDEVIIVRISGEHVALRVVAPIDVVASSQPGVSAVVTTSEPDEGVGVLADVDGVRRTSASVGALPGAYVVATASDLTGLPAVEERFYVVVALLALLLLALAGTTLLTEQRTLHERAAIDPLTQLPNRGEFERRALEVLGAVNRAGQPACLMLFDLDGFKQLNDTHGHHAGDELLRTVGRRLAASVRSGDLVARWGGDEFVVLMPGMVSAEMGVRRARQIAERVADPVLIAGVSDEVVVGASVGVAMWRTHADDLRGLVEAADAAMYRAKSDRGMSAVALAGPVGGGHPRTAADGTVADGTVADGSPGSAAASTLTR